MNKLKQFLPRLVLYFALAQALLLTGTAVCAEPFFDKTNLFEAGKDGYATYRVPGIVATTRGTLLAYCEARKSLRGDWGAIDIMMRRSTDGGKTWEKQRKIVNIEGQVAQNPLAHLAKEGEINVHNSAAIVDYKNNAIHFLYCIEYACCYYMRSDDDGRTFTKPIEITETFEKFRSEYDWKVLATGPGHGIQLKNGRLLVPVWLSTGTGWHGHRPSCVSVIYSDDHGRVWQRGDIIAAHPNPVNPSEATVIQLNDGRVMINIRTEEGREQLEDGRVIDKESKPHLRAVSISPDGATGWSKIIFHEQLPEPVCKGSIIRFTERPAHQKNRILFSNPHSRRHRENVTVKLSYDEGKTWPIAKSIEPGLSGYSDLAVGPDGFAYCFYERGGVEGNSLAPESLTVARFNLEWLTDGKDHLK